MAEGSIDERAPLLDRAEAGESSPPPEKKRTWWTIGWYAVWTVLGVFVAAVFVKGFIDADDIEVSIVVLLLVLQVLAREEDMVARDICPRTSED